jgi:hypothetical protein
VASYRNVEIFGVIFAYFSPEITFPLASALGACVGFIFLVGRAPFRVAAKALRFASMPFRRARNQSQKPTDRVSPQ